MAWAALTVTEFQISSTATDAAGNTSKGTNLKVADKTPPAAPKVNSVNDKSTSVKGKTEAGATVTVKVKNKKLGEAKANKKGEFTALQHERERA